MTKLIKRYRIIYFLKEEIQHFIFFSSFFTLSSIFFNVILF